MKKILIRVVIAALVLLIVAVVAISMSLNGAIKKVVETVGPKITKVSVKLDSVNLSILSGSCSLKGFVIGNPEGFKTPEAMSVGLASVSVAPGSIFSDKVVVKSIRVEAPKATIELGPEGMNLQRIQKNLESSSGGSPATPQPESTPADSTPGKKLQVDEVIVTGGMVTLNMASLGGKVIDAPLPEIKLEKLGQGPEGITAAELGKVILSKINEEAIKTYGDKLAEAGAQALDNVTANATNAVNKAASDAINKASKGLNDFLNKK